MDTLPRMLVTGEPYAEFADRPEGTEDHYTYGYADLQPDFYAALPAVQAAAYEARLREQAAFELQEA